MIQVVAPQPRLCFKWPKRGFRSDTVVHIAFFAVDERRQPSVRSCVLTPAVEIKVIAAPRGAAITLISTAGVRTQDRTDGCRRSSTAKKAMWTTVSLRNPRFGHLKHRRGCGATT